jgi:lipopolysaccharide transport system permease protein
MIEISARRGLRTALREVWEYRELAYFLVWRDIKVRYKQTLLGAAWAILQPFLLMVVFSVVLGKFAKLPSNGLPYPVFTFAALVPWMLFAQALTAASDSLVNNGHLVSKVYFPRILMPLAAAAACLVDFAIACTILVGLMLAYGIEPTINIAFVPLLALFAFAAALSIGIWLTALNVRYRDFKYAVPFMIQLWLFVTPVAYSSTLVPDEWRELYALNPMAGVVEGFRWALLGSTSSPGPMIAVSATVVAVVLAGGVAHFVRAERKFADVI